MKNHSLHMVEVSLCLFAVILLLSTPLWAQSAVSARDVPTSQVPRMMTYEGYLTGSDGKPLPDGMYDFTFSLYTSAEGGTEIWSEAHKKVKVTNGVIRVQLGKSSNAKPLDVPFDQPYFLGIRIGNDPEMTPRLELATSAYSFRAITADEVPDGSITTQKLATQAVTDDKIQSVSWSKIIGLPDADGQSSSTKPGAVPSNVWHITGNTKTDTVRNYVGTADRVGLAFRTSNIERMTIAATGKVSIRSDLDVDGYVTSRVSPTEGGFLLADPEHGLKRVGNDDVRLFTTNGNILMEGGNVGIGTTTPSAKLQVDGTVKINSNLSGSDNNITNYPVLVDAKDQGIAIRLDGYTDSNNNFISFWNDYGCKGRIEGQSIADRFNDPEWIFNNAIDLIEIAVATSELVGAGASAHGCVGLGACAAPPIPSLIVAASVSLAAQTGRFLVTNAYHFNNIGIGYESGSADYAEWLERLNKREVIKAGDIVGVYGGKITKATRGAQQVLPISQSPVVLGNMPDKDKEHLYEKVTFMGQVPVKVIGRVKEGDYIIPSGLQDGTGIAVSPALMTADEFAKVVGRAWDQSDKTYAKLINVAVGLNPTDVAGIIKNQQAEITRLKTDLQNMRTQLAAMNGLNAEVAKLREAMSRLEATVPSASFASRPAADGRNSIVEAKQ